MTTEAQRIMASLMSEQQLLDAVIERARGFGWRTVHFRPAKTKYGWRTAVQGDGEGWPDLVLLRGSVGIAAELKSETGHVLPEQEQWLAAFAMAGFVTYIWRPTDWHSGRCDDVLRDAR